MAKYIILNILVLAAFITVSLLGWNTDNKPVILGSGILIGFALSNLYKVAKIRQRA